MRIACISLSIYALFLCHSAAAQLTSATPDPVTLSATLLEKQYAQAFIAHPQLYNGPEYIDYPKRYHASIGHQYFLSDKKQSGSVYYNQHSFKDLQLAYDVVLDQVVIQHATSPLDLTLISKAVRDFTIDNHHFIRLETDSATSNPIRTGYYEVLVDSTVQLLAKRAKRTQEKIAQRYVDLEFTTIDRLFLKKDGAYYPVSKKSAVIRLFADHSKEVQQYIQEHKLKFKKAHREADIVQLTRYYAGLRKQ